MCCWCSPCRGSSRSSERGSGVELAGQSGRSLRRARQRRQGAAGLRRTEAAARGGFFSKPQIQHSKFKIQNYYSGRSLRSARKFGYELRTSATRLRYANPYGIDFACGSSAAERTGLHERTCGTRSCSPPPGGGCGLPVATRPSSTQSTSQRTAAKGGCELRWFHPEPQIQDSIFRIYELGAQLAKDAHERTCGREMRAFAGRSYGPLTSCEADTYTKSARSRADGLARADLRDANCSPPPGGGCGLRRPAGAIQNSKFKIQNYKIGLQAARATASKFFKKSIY